MLTQYTSYDEIRAALGVAEEEIPDDVLSLPKYELELGFELDELAPDADPTLNAHFLTLIDSVATPSPSVDQTRYVSIMKVYATYSVARQLLKTLPMFAPQGIRDAKTGVDRIADPYAQTLAGVASFYEQMRTRLLAAYLELFPSATVEADVEFVPLLATGLAS